jgi:hypothetical protein
MNAWLLVAVNIHAVAENSCDYIPELKKRKKKKDDDLFDALHTGVYHEGVVYL